MIKGKAILATILGVTWWAMGCGGGTIEGREPDTGVAAEKGSEDALPPSPFVEREFWLALAEEPGWHLNAARDAYLEGQKRQAAEDLEKVAAILNFETRHSHSSKERGLLLASVSELREVAKGLRPGEGTEAGGPSLTELDRVSALAFRTIAAHQVALARDALEEGDARMAGRYIRETVKALENGFDRKQIPLGTTMAADLGRARGVAEHLETEGDGTREEGLAILDSLDTAVAELGNVITDRRR